jgi:hypothetical protein
MKKPFMAIVVALFFIYGGNVGASSYDVDISGLSGVFGFGFDIDAPEGAAEVDFEYLIGDAVPSAGYWDVWFASVPTIGIQGLDYTISAPLIDGTIVTISSVLDFDLSNFRLGGSAGAYEGQFIVVSDLNPTPPTHTYTTPIPIPSTIILLGGGLIGLVAIRRRRA